MFENELKNELASTGSDAIVIEWETVGELCPAEANAFVETLERYGLDEVEFAWWYDSKTSIDVLAHNLRMTSTHNFAKEVGLKRPKNMAARMDANIAGPESKELEQEGAKKAAAQIVASWKNLRRAFRDATRVGNSCLRLGIAWLDSEDERYDYDSFDPVYYTVDGAYELSPAGEMFKEKLGHVYDLEMNG